jgi:hypothetical protein
MTSHRYEKRDSRSALQRLREAEGIPYAIVRGMARNLHGYERMTRDVDVLMTEAALEKYVQRCVGPGYRPAFPGARKSFRDTISQTPIEVLISGDYPLDGEPKPVSFPDPQSAAVDVEGIRVISLEKPIELKLASGMSAPHRLRDRPMCRT